MAYSTPRTWVASEYPTAAQLNANLRDNLNAAFPLGAPDVAWTAWTPTLTNITLGNGTLAAAYTRIGRTIHYRFKFVMGTTSTMGSDARFSLPVSCAAAYTTESPIGDVNYLDNGTTNWRGQVWPVLASTGRLLYFTAAATSGLVTATQPFTWTNLDNITATGTYEAAS